MTWIKGALSLAALFLAFSAPARGANYKTEIQISPYNLIFTKVRINDREVLALIDSGSFRAVEVSSTLARELSLPLADTTKVARRYGGKDFYLKSGLVDRLQVGDFESRQAEIDVIEGDIENISKQVNTDFAVILGWGFLSRFYATVDYKNHVMQFGESPLAPGQGEWSVSFSVVNNAPVIQADLANQPVSLLFDTGAPMCNLDVGLAGVAANEKVSKEVQIEKRRFLLEWRVKDLSAIKKSLGCGGVLGNNFLKEYAVYIDPKAKVIHFR
jgi:hypothetical protein